MTEAFLETSALIETTFWSADQRAQVQAAMPVEREESTSAYVIYEVARGFLRHLILLHNRTLVVRDFAELIEFAASLRLRPHYMGTVLGSVRSFYSKSTAYKGANGRELLMLFRGHLRNLIRRGWRTLRTARKVIDEVGCRAVGNPVQGQDGLFDQVLSKKLCGDHRSCGIKTYIMRHREDFMRLRDRLRGGAPDIETRRRIRALREMYRVAGRNFKAGDCYSCSDSIIAHECPVDAVLITKNGKHYVDACDVFGKRITAYA